MNKHTNDIQVIIDEILETIPESEKRFVKTKLDLLIASISLNTLREIHESMK